MQSMQLFWCIQEMAQRNTISHASTLIERMCTLFLRSPYRLHEVSKLIFHVLSLNYIVFASMLSNARRAKLKVLAKKRTRITEANI